MRDEVMFLSWGYPAKTMPELGLGAEFSQVSKGK